MLTILKEKSEKLKTKEGYIMVEIRGLSTDTKPIETDGLKIDNGSVFIETNTQKIFFYDLENQEWIGEE